MEFKRNLDEMRAAYENKPPSHIWTPTPDWMTETDPLGAIRHEKGILMKKGRIYYAALVQANTLLFDRLRFSDHPAALIYTTSAFAESEPYMLGSIAHMLYEYKNKPEAEVPPVFREIAASITDEIDRTGYEFTLSDDSGVELPIYYRTFMVFRWYLPGNALNGRIFPILAAPEDCRSVLILPKKYWTAEFKKAWKKRAL